jgi:hypothetical protein
MLVGLSYFGALSLYFLKKEAVEEFKRWTGLRDDIEWLEFERPDFKVLMPGPEKPAAVEQPPVRRAFRPECFSADYDRALFGNYQFVAGSAPVTDDGDPKPGADAWYTEALGEIVVRSGGKQFGQVRKVLYDDIVRGREVEIRLPKGRVRIARVFVINGRAYYLSVEGLGMSPNDDLARAFFESFQLPDDGD